MSFRSDSIDDKDWVRNALDLEWHYMEEPLVSFEIDLVLLGNFMLCCAYSTLAFVAGLLTSAT